MHVGKDCAPQGLDLLLAMPKIDAHAHLFTAEEPAGGALARLLESCAMRWLDICCCESEESLRTQVASARLMRARHPGRFAWVTTFSLLDFNSPDWVDRTIAAIDAGRADGAVGVKVWKNIGMELRDAAGRSPSAQPGLSYSAGRFVMIDDPRFDPVLEHIEKVDMTLAAHIGEPRNCWLPLEGMTIQGDRRYFQAHPEYHGLLHPEVPGYWEQVNARDRMLERHPGLRVVACHLGSVEFDLAEMGKRLDRFPRLSMDMAARITHLQVQERGAVREFMMRYQDRLLYGTDAALTADGDRIPEQMDELDRAYRSDFRYFTTDEVVDSPLVGRAFQCQGLALPAPVLGKLFRENAVTWYPGMETL